MSLEDTIKQLEDKYNKKENPVTGEKANPLSYISLSFHNGYGGSDDMAKEFLKDLEELEFVKVDDIKMSTVYRSKPMPENEAEQIRKLLEKKKQMTIPFVSRDDADYNGLIERYKATFTISSVKPERDRLKNHEFSIGMDKYYQRVYNFEKTLMHDSFRQNYCDAVIDMLKNDFDTSKINSKFLTEDVVKAFVYETFDVSSKFAEKNFLDRHTMHYPYQYLMDFYPSSGDERYMRYIEDNNTYKQHYHEAVRAAVFSRYDNLESLKPIKDKDSIWLKKEVDVEQLSDPAENLNTGYQIARSYEPCKTLQSLISKTALDMMSVRNADAINSIIQNTDLNAAQIKNAVSNYFKDFKYLENWEKYVDLTKGLSQQDDVYFKQKRTMKP